MARLDSAHGGEVLKRALRYGLAALILVVVAAITSAALAVVPFLLHGDISDALLTGAGSVAVVVVGLLFRAWRERRNSSSD
ncbi:hypothetical protein FXF51_06210 [Nonomuraea sp. PA05]|uniref:hypothetical protein n=1 Tax=Nonomuraea sp. PA05 TaxID=2604466 RepID=UPI0011D61B9B|nr:hypothetical protein [Nonomuraea sp. PA05]TYB69754.1 hypothetical protein FXF51_06210 [Nonomuraea sp. PA05]